MREIYTERDRKYREREGDKISFVWKKKIQIELKKKNKKSYLKTMKRIGREKKKPECYFS